MPDMMIVPLRPLAEAVAYHEPVKSIFSRFGGHAGLAGHALFGLFGREVPDGRGHAVPA